MSLQRGGGWAAVAWPILGLAGIAAIILREGAGVSDPFDGAQMMQFILESPLLYKLAPLTGVVAGCLLVVVALGMQERLAEGTPSLTRLSAAFGVMAGGLFLLSGMMGLSGGEMLVQAHTQNASTAQAAYLPVLIAADTAGAAGLVAMGLWIGLVGGVGLYSARLPRPLCYFCLVSGVMLAGTVVNMMVGVAGSVLALVGLPWLGAVMVRS
jgi:hypothetical protein